MTIPVVQGTYVEPPVGPTSGKEASSALYVEAGGGGFRPEQQSHQYRDVAWAVAFVLHLVGMLAVISLNIAGNAGNGNGGGDVSYNGIMIIVGITALVSISLGTLSLRLMMRYATGLVKFALVSTVALSGVFAVLGFLSGSLAMGLLNLLFFAISVCYAMAVRFLCLLLFPSFRRIRFANHRSRWSIPFASCRSGAGFPSRPRTSTRR